MSGHLRVAYLANYQGDDLVARRRLKKNRALAGAHKIATVAALLVQAGCEVTVFSLGAVAQGSFGLFRHFEGQTNVSPHVPVIYQSDWDIPIAGRIWGTLALLISLLKHISKRRVDVIVVYNCGLPEIVAARFATLVAGTPVVLEYEDDASTGPDGRRGWRQYGHLLGLKLLRSSIRGVVGVSPQLLSQFKLQNRHLLRGVLSDDLRQVRGPANPDNTGLRFMFSGSIQESKGVRALCEAWKIARLPGCELHVVGDGPLLPELKKQFGEEVGLCFHGFVSRSKLLDLYSAAHVMVNPHHVADDVGGIFPFKLIEYLGTGRPAISTPMAPLDGPLASGVFYSESDRPIDLAQAMCQIHGDFPHWLSKAEISMRETWGLYGPAATREALLSVLKNAVGSADKLSQSTKNISMSTQA